MSRKVVLVAHDTTARDDRGSQHLAARGYAVEWCCPRDGDALPAIDDGYAAAVVYGGIDSVNDHRSKSYLRRELDWIERWVARGKPFLGICLGSQLLAHSLGARVGPHPEGWHEYGYVQVTPTGAGQDVFPGPIHLYQAHNEGFELPRGAEHLAASPSYPHQAFRFGERTFGFQFHPEVSPEIMLRWLDLDAGSPRMAQPGVHSRAQQIEDARRYNEAMTAWFTGFLDRWLEQA